MLKSFVFLTLMIINDVVLGAPDYKFNRDVNGWLKLHKVPAIWQDAFKTCHAAGAVLASPLTPQLEKALREIMAESPVNRLIFLGANSFWSETDFMSIEGVPLDDMSITWGSYGNGTKPEDCLTLSTDGRVYASSCKQYLPYICYKKNEKTLQLNECGTFDDDYHFTETTGSCYKVHGEKTTWKQAYKTCVAEGAHLVVVNDKQEADVVMALFSEDDFGKSDRETTMLSLSHTGLRAIVKKAWDSDFVWATVTGDRVEDVYFEWAVDQPDDKPENSCVSLLNDGTFDNRRCNEETKFVCEKDPNTSRFERVADEE